MTTPRRLALIIGAMKSGTSNLFFMLRQHPQIACCANKEPNFFSDDEQFAKGHTFYASLWEWDPSVHTIALEASTAYTKFPHQSGVAQRIAAAGDTVKLIYIMRHPVERIESHIRQGLYQGFSRSLDEGLAQEEVDFSRYALQIDQYLGCFPRESLLLLTLEEYKLNGQEVLNRVCRHLEIDEGFVFSDLDMIRHDGTVYQRHAAINKLWLESSVYRVVGWPYRTLAKISRWVLPGCLRDTLKRTLVETDRGRFRFDDAERQEIITQLAPDLRRLKSVYGIDTDRHWNLPG